MQRWGRGAACPRGPQAYCPGGIHHEIRDASPSLRFWQFYQTTKKLQNNNWRLSKQKQKNGCFTAHADNLTFSTQRHHQCEVGTILALNSANKEWDYISKDGKFHSDPSSQSHFKPIFREPSPHYNWSYPRSGGQSQENISSECGLVSLSLMCLRWSP